MTPLLTVMCVAALQALSFIAKRRRKAFMPSLNLYMDSAASQRAAWILMKHAGLPNLRCLKLDWVDSRDTLALLLS